MQHVRFANVYSLGDVCSTPNSKTAAAVRKQAPFVANEILTGASMCVPLWVVNWTSSNASLRHPANLPHANLESSP